MTLFADNEFKRAVFARMRNVKYTQCDAIISKKQRKVLVISFLNIDDFINMEGKAVDDQPSDKFSYIYSAIPLLAEIIFNSLPSDKARSLIEAKIIEEIREQKEEVNERSHNNIDPVNILKAFGEIMDKIREKHPKEDEVSE